MAKKKIPEEKSTTGSFNKINDLLNKIAPDGELIEQNPIAKIDEFISSGWYILNAALSGSLFGGLPNRRSLGLAGAESSGKTFIALSLCRNAQLLQDYNIIYFDSEGAIDVEFVKRLGIDTSRFRLQPVNTIEEFNHIGAQIIKSHEEAETKKEQMPKIMVVLDSLGNLTSDKERDDATDGKDKRDMTKQQSIRKMFRVLGLKFAKFGIPLVVLAHTYDSMSMFTPKEISGGGGLKYNASIIFVLSKGKLDDAEGEKQAKLKNIDAEKVGITVYVTPFKQRFARPIKVQIHIPFYKKPNPFVGLEKFLSWDSCGILRGKCLSEKEFSKLSQSEKDYCYPFIDSKGTQLYAMAKDTARTIVCKHLDGEVPLSELFTEKVFTQEILRELDEKIIRPTFELPSIESLDDIDELTKELEYDGDIEEENQD